MEFPGKFAGQSTAFLWNTHAYAHFTISINRFVAIVFPFSSATILTMKNTIFAIVLCCLIALCYAIPYCWANTCYYVYIPTSWRWTYADTECGYTLTLFDLYSFSTLAAAMLLINVATFIKLRMVHRSSIKNSGNVANGFDAKRRLEIRFFVQPRLG
ncbi:hypothetical protein OESDEN_08805 [Oesophagostomum dentatum]|uniref:7TM GPCR serpentine receptor class x (Srx) domain-containing protein n=1 Tax=Oesophagostomum dentatum TaxID=61180 RepID=A0A0B1T1A6_OESDE|nr:hypothetical protein OESDEN_08805 [Oesophagostomum dentatum]